MVVEACADNRQRLRTAKDHIDPVVDDIVSVIKEAVSQCQETHYRQAPLIGLLRKAVGHNLLNSRKASHRECTKYVIAIRLGKRVPLIFAALIDVTLCIGVAGYVQPVTAPTFTIAGRSQ